MRRLKIGDTFVIEGTITHVYPGNGESFRYQTATGGQTVNWLSIKHIARLTAPWAPAVGEEVDVEGRTRLTKGYTVLAIHKQDHEPHRQWAVVAFGSDIPLVVLLSRLQERTT